MMHGLKNRRDVAYGSLLAAGAFAVCVPQADAAVISWLSAQSGPFQTSTNWMGGTVPGGADQAVFNVAGQYTVSFTTPVTNQRLTVRRGDVDFNLSGQSYSLTLNGLPSVYVGLFTSDNAILRLRNGTLDSRDAQLGVFTGSTGETIVSGASTVWSLTGELLIADSGVAALAITGGSRVQSSAIVTVGASQSGRGELTVTGDGSRLIAANEVRVAPLSGESAETRAAVPAQGVLNVIGAGRVEAPLVSIGANGVVQGSGLLIGTSVLNGGTVRPGEGVGSLRVQGGYTQTSAGVLELEIGGLPPQQGGTNSDFLAVSGVANLAGVIRVSLAGGYQPQVNDTITILTASSVTGSFSGVVYTQPPPSGMGWQLQHNANNVRIRWTGQTTLGDLNNDGRVNSIDLTQMLGAWGPGPSPADLNADGFVNSIDLAILLAAWSPPSN